MKFFKDKKLKEEISVLDFGIVQAGTTKEFTFYVLNDSRGYLNHLEFSIKHDEIKILEAPEELRAGESGKIVLEWLPSITLKEGLKAELKVLASELYGVNYA